MQKMVRTCYYPGCINICKKTTLRKGSQTKGKLTFHRFPTHDGDRLKLWLIALNLNINTQKRVIKRWRICSNHFFVPDDFHITQNGRELLKTSAVPHMVAVQRHEVCWMCLTLCILYALHRLYLSTWVFNVNTI